MEEERRVKGYRKFHIDIPLLFCVAVLVIFGLVMIYSTSAFEANREMGDSAFYLKRQIGSILFGIVIMGLAALFPYELYKKLPWWIMPLVAAVSVILIFTPLAYSANGATRWIRIAGLSIQPAEIVKVCMIIYTAKYLHERTRVVETIPGALQALAVPMIFAFSIFYFTSNLSSGVIIASIAVMMVFVCTKDYKKLFIVIGVAALLIFIFVFGVKRGWNLGYRGDRIKAWLNPEEYSSDEGYQTLQALYAIGSGGFAGKGIGESVQKLGFIPEAQNDMIFSIICEELGIMGAFLIMGMFLMLITRCWIIASRSKDMFGCLLATGVMVHLAVQVILNIAVVTNLVPNTGISLPFISYGGTAIVFQMAEIGIVLNVARKMDV